MRKRKKEKEYIYIYMRKREKYELCKNKNKVKLPGSLKCIRNSKASRLKDPYSFSNHVQSDNEDFLCASGSLFAIWICPPISKCVYFSFSPP
jgi:hypothetical protein